MDQKTLTLVEVGVISNFWPVWESDLHVTRIVLWVVLFDQHHQTIENNLVGDSTHVDTINKHVTNGNFRVVIHVLLHSVVEVEAWDLELLGCKFVQSVGVLLLDLIATVVSSWNIFWAVLAPQLLVVKSWSNQQDADVSLLVLCNQLFHVLQVLWNVNVLVVASLTHDSGVVCTEVNVANLDLLGLWLGVVLVLKDRSNKLQSISGTVTSETMTNNLHSSDVSISESSTQGKLWVALMSLWELIEGVLSDRVTEHQELVVLERRRRRHC